MTTCLSSGFGRTSNTKNEEVYPHVYDSVNDAERGLEKYFMFYNQNRSHTALDDKTLDGFYFDNLPAIQRIAQALITRFPVLRNEKKRKMRLRNS